MSYAIFVSLSDMFFQLIGNGVLMALFFSFVSVNDAFPHYGRKNSRNEGMGWLKISQKILILLFITF